MVTISVVIFLFALTASFLLILRAFSVKGNLPLNSDWIDDLTDDRYRPMLRLLDEDDFNYLKSQPGYTHEMGAKFRAQRLRIFESYLSWIRGDFARLSMALSVLTLQSKHDRPDLATALLRHRVAFAFGLMVVHARLWLYRGGFRGLDVGAVVAPVEAMRIQLRSLSISPAGAAA